MEKIWEKIKNGDNLSLIILTLIFILFCICFWGRCQYPLVDVGREIIIPKAILNGKILYKDILNIYGPLSYYINAFACKIAGVKFNTLFSMGALSGFVFIYSFYFLSREFLKKKLSFILTFFVMTACVFNSALFNFLFPYSYSLPFGLAAYTLTVLMLIKYIKSGDDKFAYIASFSAGFCISNKIEFYWLPFILAGTLFFIKKQNKINLIKSLCLFLIFPLISLVLVLAQGNSFSDILTAAELIKKSALTSPMIYFHHNIGLYPSGGLLLKHLKETIIFCLFLLFWGTGYFTGSKNFFLNFIFIPLWMFIYIALDNGHNFSLFPIIVSVLALINYKKLWNDKTLLILVISAVGASLKTYFSLTFNSYGEYTLPLIILAFCVMIVKFYRPKFNLEKYIIYVLTILSLSYGLYNVYMTRHNLTYKLNIYGNDLVVEKGLGLLLDETVNYVKKHSQKSDKLLVYPEGVLVNYLTEREPDYMYYSLHPIFMETFGEDNVIQKIKENKIEYIMVINGVWNNDLFGKNDYHKFLKFVDTYYTFEKVFFIKNTTASILLYKLTL